MDDIASQTGWECRREVVTVPRRSVDRSCGDPESEESLFVGEQEASDPERQRMSTCARMRGSKAHAAGVDTLRNGEMIFRFIGLFPIEKEAQVA